MDVKLEPVPRGYWIETIIVKQDCSGKVLKREEGFACSVCKERAPENKKHNYCPECGARMKV